MFFCVCLNLFLLFCLPQIGCEPPEQTTDLAVAELACRTLQCLTGRLHHVIKDDNGEADGCAVPQPFYVCHLQRLHFANQRFYMPDIFKTH